MKHFVAAVVAAIAVVSLAALPAGAVTWLTINGATSGTITTPGPIVVRSNASAVGAKVHLVLGADLNANGRLDAGEPVMATLGCVQDNQWMDEDATAGVVQFTGNVPVMAGGSVVMQAVDQDGSTVGHIFSLNYAHPGQSVAGTVLYNDGTPGAGLLVSTMREDGTVYFTNASGAYVLYLSPGQQAVAVTADTEGGDQFSRTQRSVPVARWVDLAASEAKTGVNFTFMRGTGPDLVGTVIESDTSLPAPGCVVRAEEMTTMESVSAMADINGSYRLHVFPGTWTVYTDVMGQDGAYTDPVEQTVPVSAADVNVDFSLPRFSNRIYGIVTGPGAAPLATAWVEAYSTTTFDWYDSDANALGRYEIWLPADTYYVAPSDDAGNLTFLMHEVPQVTVPPASRTDFAMTPRAYTLSGRVTLAGTSTGVPYAEISLDDIGGLYTDWFGATTDGQGYYSLKVPSGDFDVYADSYMYNASGGPVSLTFGPSQSNINFSLTPSHTAPVLSAGGVDPASGGVGGQVFTFSVTYTSADGTPPMDVYVIIDSWPKPMEPADPLDTTYSDGAVYTYATTLATGTHTFRFGALDQAHLQARLPDAGSLSVTAVAGGDVSGQVREMGTGTNIAGAEVEAYLGSVLKGTATTDANGMYSITQGLATGTYVLVASKGSYVSQTKPGIVVTAGATSYVNFNLQVSGKLKGQVLDRVSGAPIIGATIAARTGGVVWATGVTTGPYGIYEIASDLPAGTYSLLASKAGYQDQGKIGIVVSSGATTYVNFSLGQICLMGQVRQFGTTTNLAGATVAAYDGAVLKATATTDSNGIYQIGGLTTGTYTVVASKSGYAKQTKPGIAVTADVVTYVNFSLQVSGKLKGQVTEQGTGVPIIGATVSARTGGVVQATGTTVGPYGIYEISSDLPAGTYTMLCTKAGYQDFGRIGIVVTSGATTYVNFPLPPLP